MVSVISSEYKQAFSKANYIIAIHQINSKRNIIEVVKYLQSRILAGILQIKIPETSKTNNNNTTPECLKSLQNIILKTLYKFL